VVSRQLMAAGRASAI